MFDQEHTSKPLQILAAAERLFSEKGYDATSVREIAKASGINVAMISYYFGSKEKLLEKIFEYRINLGFKKASSIINDPEIDFMKKFEVLLRGYIGNVHRAQNFYLVMISTQITSKNKRILSMIRKSRTGYMELYRQLMEYGLRTGSIQHIPDIQMLLSTINGTVYFALQSKGMFKTYSRDTSPIEEYDRDFFERLLHHLLTIIKSILQSAS